MRTYVRIVCFLLLLPLIVQAGVEYVYQGNALTACDSMPKGQQSACSGRRALQITLEVDTPLAPNTIYSTETGNSKWGPAKRLTIISWTISDGHNTLRSSCPIHEAYFVESYYLATDEHGAISAWRIDAAGTAHDGAWVHLATEQTPGRAHAADKSEYRQWGIWDIEACNLSSPGTWHRQNRQESGALGECPRRTHCNELHGERR